MKRAGDEESGSNGREDPRVENEDPVVIQIIDEDCLSRERYVGDNGEIQYTAMECTKDQRKEEVVEMIIEHKVNVVAIQETKLTEHNVFNLTNYNIIK